MAKIMLVEDDFALRDIYSASIQANGHQVVTASDGEEALAVAMREHPELIILDVMMPKISGFDVLDILRSTPETKTTKVIMMTALSQDSDRKRGEALGVNKYLVKSQVTLEDVMAAIKQVLSGEAGPAVLPSPASAMPTQPTGPQPATAAVGDAGEATESSEPVEAPGSTDSIESSASTESRQPIDSSEPAEPRDDSDSAEDSATSLEGSAEEGVSQSSSSATTEGAEESDTPPTTPSTTNQ
jgi:DNA-binding response OmpR family regulator